MRNLLSVLFVTLSLANLNAQHSHCGTDEYYNVQLKNNPSLKNIEIQSNAETERLLKEIN